MLYEAAASAAFGKLLSAHQQTAEPLTDLSLLITDSVF
jgi:hypothetical protein